jgi:rhodanese-related sulfurtransferase
VTASTSVLPPPRFASVQDLLDDARSRLVRVSATGAARAVAAGALIVDIRPAWQRAVTGEVPGALIVERNHLEWRLHPESDARLPEAVPGQEWLVICHEGYTSSLAADALRSLGVPATDIDGGFLAWRAAGLPTVATVTPANAMVHAVEPA